MWPSRRRGCSNLEHIRRWGLICPCQLCNDRRKQGDKNIECVYNGRRIHEAWDFIQDRSKEFTRWSKQVTVADCEGDNAWCDTIRKMCQRSSSELKRDNKYLGTIPWLFTTADTVKGAAKCVELVNKYPLEEQDPFVVYFVGRVGNDLRIRAAGGDLSTDLALEVRRAKWGSLNESCGEGYHRGTNHEHVRSPSATTIHLKSKVRQKNVIKTCRSFAHKYKEAGKAVLRLEWMQFARILQTSRKRRWRNRKMPFLAVLRRVYRQDERALENWSAILRRVPLERTPVTGDPSVRDRLETECLENLLLPKRHFGVDHSVTERRDDGTAAEVVKRELFTVVNVQHSKARRSLMHTVETADEVESTQPFALEVQFTDRWRDPDAVGDETSLRVFAESDPEWVVPNRIASFGEFTNRLFRYEEATPDAEHPACEVWSGMHKALPSIPIMDERCPAILQIAALKKFGWRPAQHAVTHTEVKP